jgi:hypothetical protein
MRNETTPPLSPAETQTLQRIVGIMVPADPAYRVPSASDPAIFDDVLASLGHDLGGVRSAIATLTDQLSDAGAETAVRSFLATPSRASAALSRVVLQCYYRDDRVLQSLGHDARPPYPRGNVVDQGDWSLLDVVRNRPPFWRDDRRE